MWTQSATAWLVLPAILVQAVPAPQTVPTKITVQNFNRTCTDLTCSYNFVINYAPYGTQTCTIVDTVKPEDQVADLHSWYNVGCVENPSTWQISWGWDYKDDFTVLTIKNDPNQYLAYFGYDKPNTGASPWKYADETKDVKPVGK